MTATFRITPRAHEDLKNIGRYTVKTWGKEQRDRYLESIDKRFSWLAENPLSGRYRTEIKEGYYSYLQGSHVIFYMVRNGGIDIIGIPHQQMDMAGYFTTH
ncbi:MAG: type II toxin-antitoxin system RelE/ParE family toxin [Burkholderiaceae bacterium]|nr:type II toxin-antitoxin system RelE/ParE family toxin [Burkholderiaceae bacterium]